MNEQLIVKNFGPIKDATVDFKRVTVFIGPTGGGKSTLAKLAAIFRDEHNYKNENSIKMDHSSFNKYSISSYTNSDTSLNYKNIRGFVNYKNKDFDIGVELLESEADYINDVNKKIDNYIEILKKLKSGEKNTLSKAFEILSELDISKTEFEHKSNYFFKNLYPSASIYIPSERSFISSLEYSWAGLMRDDIGLPKILLDFANSFSISRRDILELYIPFFSVTYKHIDGKDFIKIPEREEPLVLLETASGIQSVTPMLVLLEHLSQQKEQAQSFIIEEPELNLYPTAQQGLMNWLVEKCTKGENDLTITTHSPYILSHLNLLLYAYQVAENHPDRVDDVAKIVPRESWIDPKEFACYHVEGQKENGVHSIVNPETRLISYNMLDAIAGMETTDFEKLLDINAGLEVE